MSQPVLSARSRRRKRIDGLFRWFCFGAAALGVLLLIVLLAKLVMDGKDRLSFDFIRGEISGRPRRTGIWPAIIGSLWIMALTALCAVPMGIAAAVYLEEFTQRKNRLTDFIQLNIANLAGVPSIVYGLLGLAVFSRFLSLEQSVLAGGLTMSLLVLPTVIIVSQEALRAVPRSYREASLGLGSTQWQAIRFQVLPNALPGIFTGVILALSRAIGETAPLIVVGAVSGVVSAPDGVRDRYTALPLQIFSLAGDSRAGADKAAAAGILVLVAALLMMNSVAIALRNRAQARVR